MSSHADKKMAIIAGYIGDESYGLLGPQMAATIIENHTPYGCIVVAVPRQYDKTGLKNALADYFGIARPLIGFSALSGREDLFNLAKELKEEGAVTILAGPQADVDFLGEQAWQQHPHRFKGLAENFSFALHGPAEQAIALLDHLEERQWPPLPGLLYRDRGGRFIQNPAYDWNEKYLGNVRWNNIYMAGTNGIFPLKIKMGQVLQHIGCPYAARSAATDIEYPVSLSAQRGKRIQLDLKGCSFCDVAADKGYHGKLNCQTVVRQIQCLPESSDGRKIPFELINENPLPNLAELLGEVRQQHIQLSQINLTLRADWLIAGQEHLRRALRAAGELGIYVLLSSIGFESFDDTILRNLNKGLSVEKNVAAVGLVRRLKEEFPDQLGYSNREGAVHGFIHPTAWDTKETAAAIQKSIYLHGLQRDILPPHSTPLIIHHASALGRWIREIERREGVWFKRFGSIIGWWEQPVQIKYN
jgi:hypothetical protein